MRHLPVLLAAALLSAGPALAAPRVVASVVPVQSIVAAVMGDTGTPELLLKGSMSEHRAVFTPLPDRQRWAMPTSSSSSATAWRRSSPSSAGRTR